MGAARIDRFVLPRHCRHYRHPLTRRVPVSDRLWRLFLGARETQIRNPRRPVADPDPDHRFHARQMGGAHEYDWRGDAGCVLHGARRRMGDQLQARGGKPSDGRRTSQLLPEGNRPVGGHRTRRARKGRPQHLFRSAWGFRIRWPRDLSRPLRRRIHLRMEDLFVAHE